ncbi:DUF6233 domain-containing protein [Streptomyces cyaneus]|uniref:DUF6233 domain-containing protein n=1 Tax=Streptomyces cyaneus TaxID=1904 RepID=UPI00319E85C6
MAQLVPRPQFVVQQKRTPQGPEPAIIHVGDCTLIEGAPPSDQRARRACLAHGPERQALHLLPPDSELGIDVA